MRSGHVANSVLHRTAIALKVGGNTQPAKESMLTVMYTLGRRLTTGGTYDHKKNE
jgi:hypothetical protein